MYTRRTFFSALGVGLLGLGAYACGIEPLYRLIVKRYTLALPRWPKDAKPLNVALVADIHAVEPWMSLPRIREIVDTTNALQPDITLLLGDYMAATRLRTGILMPTQWAPELARLKAPLGAYAILGNHDYWWDDGFGPVKEALEAVDIPVLANDAHRIAALGHSFWLTGTESILTGPRFGFDPGPGIWRGRDDMARTFAKTDDSAPILHMAHEPDMLPHLPQSVALTVSGHTHGGQVRLPFIGRPMVASDYGQKLAYGHVVYDDREIVVSGGLGCSHLPVRFGVPPEVVLLTITGTV